MCGEVEKRTFRFTKHIASFCFFGTFRFADYSLSASGAYISTCFSMSHRLCQRFVGRARGVLDVERNVHGIAAIVFGVIDNISACRGQERKSYCQHTAPPTYFLVALLSTKIF